MVNSDQIKFCLISAASGTSCEAKRSMTPNMEPRLDNDKVFFALPRLWPNLHEAEPPAIIIYQGASRSKRFATLILEVIEEEIMSPIANDTMPSSLPAAV